MANTKQKLTLLINGFLSILLFLILVYLLVVVLSLGVMVVSGIYITIAVLSQCIFGFLLFLLLKMFNFLKTGLHDILVIITLNIIINWIFNSTSKVIDRSDDEITSVIIRHTPVESSAIDFNSIVVTVLCSLALYGIFNYINKDKT